MSGSTSASAPRARVDGQELFRGLAERVSSFRLETVAPEYQPSIRFRSLRELSVTMTLAAPTS